MSPYPLLTLPIFFFLVKFSVVGTRNISILICNSDSCLILIQYSNLFTAQYQPCYHGFAVKESFILKPQLFAVFCYQVPFLQKAHRSPF